ncbi:MAG: peptide-methionine (S)-S-oxide reductase MsrA [Hyphomicrobiales bacterium]|nr:peptide-methionine (S)-S-oxide reductase MsrA [Hyphomicrobiales bacterium]MCP5374032.1 peptide-methionine (S)-S-oxide reductase MsrA [Hyphomicrobiales bacterium]
MSQGDVATLAGGCFWCLEAVYLDLKGITKVVSGYMGGAMDDPDYRSVCGGHTGHAEVVQVTFDPAVISYAQILDVFFTIHDPTQLNRQGNDVGTQYRSAIFTHSDAQRAEAEAAVQRAAGLWGGAIVTEVTDAVTFWPAEDYHQDYYANNPNQPYCMFVVAPKVAKARSEFTALLKS